MDQEFSQALEAITDGLSAAREVLNSLKLDQQILNAENGISLLSLKHHILLSYLQSLCLLTARRVIGDSLNERSLPCQTFSSQGRPSRGKHLGDLIDLSIENRLIIEKAELMESKMRYQITKLVKLADEPVHHGLVPDDPLVFKANPASLMAQDSTLSKDQNESHISSGEDETDGLAVYQPPRLAPVPYVEPSQNKKRQNRSSIPTALATLPSDPSQPFTETTSGLGGTPTLVSGRAQYLRNLKEFEEENFTRVVLKKSEAKRRARDEEDLALGGHLTTGTGSRGRRRAGGLEDEFGDVLRHMNKPNSGLGLGDGYDELRKRGKKVAMLERSRLESKKRLHADDLTEPPQEKKRSRFELETKASRKRLKR